ncbi:type II toxin-antitoxin system prevent-host-death family antitoxin [Rahnella sp. AA]|uniref:type II toxin-antitoxin system Phd/YefM family antitoxin n=1 Tax=Rahnella sp. AA TaxID=2057180 RepID=UPI000C344803|nr:type II toxin-antitoxin system Phd/YefM family antitoxin [Rahnella sp. AA]PKE31597.1 type II toxin-antitoxin system prevent-host-death family antitoxin [Rahnella sp. AA]
MKEFNYTDARQNLADVIQMAAEGEPVTITRRGKAPAVIISAEEYAAFLKHKLDREFEEMMGVHGDAIRALADR